MRSASGSRCRRRLAEPTRSDRSATSATDRCSPARPERDRAARAGRPGRRPRGAGAGRDRSTGDAAQGRCSRGLETARSPGCSRRSAPAVPSTRCCSGRRHERRCGAPACAQRAGRRPPPPRPPCCRSRPSRRCRRCWPASTRSSGRTACSAHARARAREDLARSLLLAHASARDALRALLVGAGATPVAAEPAYALPVEPDGPRERRRARGRARGPAGRRLRRPGRRDESPLDLRSLAVDGVTTSRPPSRPMARERARPPRPAGVRRRE